MPEIDNFKRFNYMNAYKTARIYSKVDWGDSPRITKFYGRSKEIIQLEQWIVHEHCRMVAVIGTGGIGKTSLAAALVEQIQEQFDYVFWRSLQMALPPKSILQECIKFLSAQQQITLPEDVEEQIAILLGYLRRYRTLLVLDNCESVLQEEQIGQYRKGYEGYGRLLQHIGETSHQSCLLLTSREKPKEIIYLEGSSSPVHVLSVPGLEQIAGHKILKDKGLIGVPEAYNALIQMYSGNPLALKLVSASIYELFGGDIAEFLKERETHTGVQDLLDQQLQSLPLLERDLIYWLAIEREEVSLKDLQEDLVTPVAKSDVSRALASLHQRSLIEINTNGYFSLQPVILEYMTLVIVEQMYREICSETIGLFVSHASMKAQTKAYIRDTQVRLILAPIAEKLLVCMGKTEIEKKLQFMLSTLRETQPRHSGYAVANTIHLLLQLQYTLSGYDFSHLAVRQAYLRGVSLSGVNFTHSEIIESVFTETFGGVLSVTFSPVGNILAVGTTNGDVRLWQAPSGMLLRTLQGHTDWVRSVAFSPDGSLLASSSDDQTVRLWDHSTGRCLMTLQGHTDAVQSITFDPDGQMLASGGRDQEIRLWEVHSGRGLAVLEGHREQIWSVAFSLNGKLLASGSADQTVRLWDITTGLCFKTLQGHTDWITSVAFSPNAKTLATGSRDRTVRLWDITTGLCFKTLQGHTDWITSVAFSPNARTLATGSRDRTVRLWDITTGLCFKTLQGHTDWITSVAFSWDGEMLSSGSEEDQAVYLWDARTGQYLNTLQGYTNWVRSVAFSPRGKLLAAGSDDQMVRLWDTNTGQCINILQGHDKKVLSVTFSPDGTILASGSADRTLRLWDTSTGLCLKTLQGHTDWVRSVPFSPDGKFLASSGDDQMIRLWDTSTGLCLKTLQGHTDWVRSIAFSPDGTILASGSDDQTIRLWDTSTGLCLKTLQGHTDWVRSIAFSPDGTILASGSQDQTIRLWDRNTCQCLKIFQGHDGKIRSIAFSPDGTILASGSTDQTVGLWDRRTGQCFKILRGHTDRIWSVAFSPDGTILASGSDDGATKFWEVKTGECLQTLRNDRPYERMDIANIKGLTMEQKAMLKTLGAIECNMSRDH